MIDILLKITIAIVMIGIGTSISLKEIKKIFTKPKKIIIGLISQIILLPLLAFLIVSISNLSPAYKIGIIILAACPGGTMSNFISYLIKADTPLSIGLTSTNSFITLLTIPIYTKLAMNVFSQNMASIALPQGKIIVDMLVFVIIPLLLGISTNYFYKKINGYQKHIKILSSILIALVFTLKFILSSQSIISNFIDLIFWIVLLNVAGILLGYLIGKINKFSNKSSTTLAIEIGLQNTALALLVTDSILKQPLMGEPILIYTMLSFWITLSISFMLKKKKLKSIEKEIKKLD